MSLPVSKCKECGVEAFAVSGEKGIFYCFNCRKGGPLLRNAAQQFQKAALWGKPRDPVLVKGRAVAGTLLLFRKTARS